MPVTTMSRSVSVHSSSGNNAISNPCSGNGYPVQWMYNDTIFLICNPNATLGGGGGMPALTLEQQLGIGLGIGLGLGLPLLCLILCCCRAYCWSSFNFPR